MNKNKYKLKAIVKVYTSKPLIYLPYGEEYNYYFPLDEKKYVIKGLKIPFEITRVDEDNVHVILNGEERDFFLDPHKYAIVYQLNDNVYFHIFFQLEDNTFTYKSLNGYHLEINEVIIRSQPYYQNKKENNYSLKIVKDKELLLKELNVKILILGIDSLGLRVRIKIDDLIDVVTIDKEVDYKKSIENEPNKAFERIDKSVNVKIVKD